MPKYTITIRGEGGEFIAGEVNKEFFDALNDNDISIEDYAEGDSDDEQFECIPEEIRPFDPGDWSNLSPYIVWRNLCDTESMELEVDDENFKTVYSDSDEVLYMTEHEYDVDENGVVNFSIYDPSDPYDNYRGKYFYSCQRHEDGVFFSGTIELDEPFDPNKLCLITVNLNESEMVSKVIYYPQGPNEDGYPVGEGIEIKDVGDHETEINGATHELRML
jgi:hypothetical protein